MKRSWNLHVPRLPDSRWTTRPTNHDLARKISRSATIVDCPLVDPAHCSIPLTHLTIFLAPRPVTQVDTPMLIVRSISDNIDNQELIINACTAISGKHEPYGSLPNFRCGVLVLLTTLVFLRESPTFWSPQLCAWTTRATSKHSTKGAVLKAQLRHASHAGLKRNACYKPAKL